MSFPLIIRPEAETDMAEAFEWYEGRKEGLGYEFLAEVRNVFSRLEANPLGHAQIYRIGRRALVRRFPYKVFYVFDAEKVEIIGVVHARRHPQVWQQRIS